MSPYSWKKAFLAVIPGLLATAGLVRSDFSPRMATGMILLVGYLLLAWLSNKKRSPGWSLMALGMLTAIGLTLVTGVLGGLGATLVGGSSRLIVLIALLAVLFTLLATSLRDRRVPPVAWLHCGLIVALQLAVRLKYFSILGVSWSVAGQWLNISLYAAVVGLLLPVILGLWLAGRHGMPTMLFVIGMVFMGLQLLIDVNHKVSDQIGGTLGFFLYQASIPLLFTVVAPLCFLRAGTDRGRFAGLMTLVGLSVILDLVVVGLSYKGALPTIIWISFIPHTLSILLAFRLAALFFENRQGTCTDE